MIRCKFTLQFINSQMSSAKYIGWLITKKYIGWLWQHDLTKSCTDQIHKLTNVISYFWSYIANYSPQLNVYRATFAVYWWSPKCAMPTIVSERIRIRHRTILMCRWGTWTDDRVIWYPKNNFSVDPTMKETYYSW